MTGLSDTRSRVVVVGASRAGLSAAEALRDGGFDGHLVVLGAETRAPYDRTGLSTSLLTGRAGPSDLALDVEALDVEWRLGERVDGVDLAERAVVVGGSRLGYDGLVIAAGARPRTLPGLDGIDVRTLRSLDDALALRDALEHAASLTVIGGGFIGCEVAASARSLGVAATIVEAGPAPLARVLGTEVGDAMARRLRAAGVDVRCGRTVAGATRAGLRLDDGSLVPGEHVLVAVGVEPETAWLRDSGLPLDGGVVCDATCAAGAPDVVAAGDVARWRHPGLERLVRVEHWDNAEAQGAAAARRLLHGPDCEPFSPVPYVWSDQGPHVLRVAGWPDGDPVLVDGSLEDGPFTVEYVARGEVRAVLAVDDLRGFRRRRARLQAELASA